MSDELDPSEDSGRASGDQAEREPEFPYSKFELNLIEAARRLAGHPRHAAANAIRGLRLAWQVAPLDQEMAFFRALTAQEEDATALMVALRQRGYPNAKALHYRDHVHKAAVPAFLRVLNGMFAELRFPAPLVKIDLDSPIPRLNVHIPSERLGMDAGYHLTPDQPLNIVMGQRVGKGPPDSTGFEDAFKKLASINGQSGILAYLEKEANIRNPLLYSTSEGIAVVKNVDAELRARKSSILLLIGLTIIVLQTRELQLFATQAVSALAEIITSRTIESFDFERIATPVGPQLTVTIPQEGKPTASITARVSAVPAINLTFRGSAPDVIALPSGDRGLAD